MFSTRNVRYLRISRHAVLQVIIYLSQEDLNWFTEDLLNQIFNLLKIHIPLRLHSDREKLASGGNKSKILIADVFCTETFRFGFWFKPIETRHAILLKHRKYVEEKEKQNKEKFPLPEEEKSEKDDQHESREFVESDVHSISSSDSDRIFDIPESNSISPPGSPEKKSVTSISYQGFSIFGLTLCIVAEPIDPTEINILPKSKGKGKRKDMENLDMLSATPSDVKINISQMKSIKSFINNGLALTE